MPIYDKPMVYYPLSALMLAGIREISSSPRRRTCHSSAALLGDGASLGLKLSYAEQPSRTASPRLFSSARITWATRPPP